MTVSERYKFGVRRDWIAVPLATTMNGNRISHFRRHAISRKSSGVYFLPGITRQPLSMQHGRLPRYADADALPFLLVRQSRCELHVLVEAMAVVEVLRLQRGSAGGGHSPSRAGRSVSIAFFFPVARRTPPTRPHSPPVVHSAGAQRDISAQAMTERHRADERRLIEIRAAERRPVQVV